MKLPNLFDLTNPAKMMGLFNRSMFGGSFDKAMGQTKSQPKLGDQLKQQTKPPSKPNK